MPQMGTPSTEAELRAIGDSDVLAMVGDSTNVFNTEASGSEEGVRIGLTDLISARTTGRVLVTTFASNAARVHTLGEVAKITGRHLVLVGRSMDRITQTAKAAGYLKDLPPIMNFEDAAKADPSSLLIVCTGAQGEPNAALSRIAAGNHSHLKLSPGDLVVYSSKQIPGNELAIGAVQNALAARGIEVITEKQAHVHVSGHPGRPELEKMYEWIRPAIAIPVHGERRHMEAHATLALECGVPRAMVPVNGSAIRLAPDGPKLLSHEKVGRLVLDGDVILPADGATMVQRRRMMMNGYLSATDDPQQVRQAGGGTVYRHAGRAGRGRPRQFHCRMRRGCRQGWAGRLPQCREIRGRDPHRCSPCGRRELDRQEAGDRRPGGAALSR